MFLKLTLWGYGLQSPLKKTGVDVMSYFRFRITRNSAQGYDPFFYSHSYSDILEMKIFDSQRPWPYCPANGRKTQVESAWLQPRRSLCLFCQTQKNCVMASFVGCLNTKPQRGSIMKCTRYSRLWILKLSSYFNKQHLTFLMLLMLFWKKKYILKFRFGKIRNRLELLFYFIILHIFLFSGKYLIILKNFQNLFWFFFSKCKHF